MSFVNVSGSLYEALELQARDTLAFLAAFLRSCCSRLPGASVPTALTDVVDGDLYGRIAHALYFTEIEFLLLKTFLLILVLTLLLIFLSWRVYGKRISERFMKPATSATIEELKESVSKLKLPKEHTPRI